MAKKQSGIPATYDQQQMMRKQRQQVVAKQGKEQMAYAQGSKDAAVAKPVSKPTDYSKARSQPSTSLEELQTKLADAQKRGASMLAKQLKLQIESTKRAGK